ncbi:M48 family metallopeptidase [Dyadobacter sp. CY323]|uniref:tetratricopeptide repeat protein n=1 Tax=Dyadobacter sp. CY323 TaxID=2907302 RepID=UPI001F16DB14|nr:hypothetical protein [Dyadobacter sp. CY323]MCE6991016.1 hypothetical protein [Dyadobacter sp. CY323]
MSFRIKTLNAWYAVAAAVILIALGLVWYPLRKTEPGLREFAMNYAMDHFTTLRDEFGDGSDSIQLAITKYHYGQYATTTNICKSILERDPAHAEAKKIAGVVSLKLLDYDQAVDYFKKLGSQKGLYANPGKFYEAVALLQRNGPGDAENAEKLLKDVVDHDLVGKKDAEVWLR